MPCNCRGSSATKTRRTANRPASRNSRGNDNLPDITVDKDYFWDGQNATPIEPPLEQQQPKPQPTQEG